MVQTLPEIIFRTRVRNDSIQSANPFEWKDISSVDLFAGRRIVLFALPGAFTPTCSSTHLPRYDELYDEFMNQGIDEVYCLSVNDAFVMNRWGKSLDNENIKLLPDGSGEFTRKIGMLVMKDNLGFGLRSWRYALVAQDMKIEKEFVEPGFSDDCADDPFEVSDADTVLAYLRGSTPTGDKPDRHAFVG